MRIIELYYSPYQNLWYLVKKSTLGKYWLVNIVVELSQVIIWDANLPFSTDKFSEEFIGYTISSLVNLFSDNDQVKLAQKSRDLAAFMTYLSLIRITILASDTSNSVTQFVRSKLKILIPYGQGWAKPFFE